MADRVFSRIPVWNWGHTWFQLEEGPVNARIALVRDPRTDEYVGGVDSRDPDAMWILCQLEEPAESEENIEYRTYDAFTVAPALFYAFAELEPTKESIKAFADEYGDVSEGHSTLAEWKYKIALLKAGIHLWDAVNAKDEDAIAHHHLEWNERGLQRKGVLSCYSLPVESYSKRRLLKPASDLLSSLLNSHAGMSVYVTPRQIAPGASGIYYQFTTLSDVLWFQFMTAVVENKQYRACKHCVRMFEVDAGRSDKQFCSDSCRVKSLYRRKALAQQMRRDSKNLREIAKATDTKIETLKQWFREDQA